MTIRLRLTLLCAIIIISVMTVVVCLLRYRISLSATEQASSHMLHSRANFESYLRQIDATLLSQCSLISDLPILKATIDTHDHATILSAANEYRSKIGVDGIMVTDRFGKLLARTDRPKESGVSCMDFPFVQAALHDQPWVGRAVEKDRIYGVVSVPVRTDEVLWGTFTAFYAVSDALAGAMKSRTGVDLTFLIGDRIAASSLDASSRSSLAKFVKAQWHGRRSLNQPQLFTVTLGNNRWLVSMTPLTRGTAESSAYFVLQYPVDREMTPFYQLQSWLLGIGLMALIIGFLASYWVSRSVTRPVDEMVHGVKSIEAGEWGHRVEVSSKDEFQVLAQSFNRMTEQLQQYLARQGSLQSFLQKMLTLHDVQAILEETALAIVNATPFDTVGIYSLTNHASELKLQACGGKSCSLLHENVSLTSPAEKDRMIAQCFNDNAVVIDREKETEPSNATEADASISALAKVALPISSGPNVLGVLLLGSDNGLSFDDDELQHPRMIADATAIAIERLRLFDEVMRAKIEWETTFNAVSLPLFLRERSGTILRANKAAAEYFGVDHETLNQSKLTIPCRGCSYSGDCAACRLWDLGLPHRTELTDAETGKIYAVHAFPIPASHGQMEAILEYVVDITSEKEESQQMLQLERLRALGEVASGVAHDFNNVLTSIYGYSQLLSMQEQDPDKKEKLALIEQSANDAAEIVRRMQTFYKTRSDFPTEMIDLNELLQEVVTRTRPRWKDQSEASGFPVTVRTDFSEIPPVSGKSSELREVFTNLIFNALDAMPEGGTLSLRTRAEDRRVIVSVSDTGTGMTPEVKARVFESFYTTKGTKGTGLGLSLAYSIISTHGGEIDVDSVSGAGSTFAVKLPAALTDEAQSQETTQSRGIRGLNVLVVDDEQKVLQVVAAMLRQEGHVASTVIGGREALDNFVKSSFDLVLTDLGMPEMNGRELARRIKSMNPRTPVIMMTGWSDQLDADELKQDGIDALIAKPVNLHDLRNAIEEVVTRQDANEKGLR